MIHKIRVESDFAGELCVRLHWRDPWLAMEPCEKAAVSVFHLALRRGSEDGRKTVEPVDLDKNRAGFRSASPAQHGGGAFMRAAPQIGRDPNIGAQPHVYDRVSRTNGMNVSASCLSAGGAAKR